MTGWAGLYLRPSPIEFLTGTACAGLGPRSTWEERGEQVIRPVTGGPNVPGVWGPCRPPAHRACSMQTPVTPGAASRSAYISKQVAASDSALAPRRATYDEVAGPMAPV